jgi:hypothetical protein
VISEPTSPVPKSEGPGAPSAWLKTIFGTGATRRLPTKAFATRVTRSSSFNLRLFQRDWKQILHFAYPTNACVREAPRRYVQDDTALGMEPQARRGSDRDRKRQG